MDDNGQEPLDELRGFLENQVKENAKKPTAEKTRPKLPFSKEYPRVLMALQLAVLAGAAIYLYASFPALKASVQPSRQVRFGVYDTDSGTEKCIASLWKAAGAPGVPAGSCPVSGLPYKTEGKKISCPSPEKHGLDVLFFSPDKGVVAKRDK